MVVHGEQRFEYIRPIVAGDVVTTQATITDIRDAGRNVLLTTRTEIRTVDGEHVCTAHSTLVRARRRRAETGCASVSEQVKFADVEPGAELAAASYPVHPAQPGQVLRRVR